MTLPVALPVEDDEAALTDEWFEERAHFLRAIFRACAKPGQRGLSPHRHEKFDLMTDDYKNHPQLLAMHSAFARHELKAIGRLGQWAKKYKLKSKLTWVDGDAARSYWRLRP